MKSTAESVKHVHSAQIVRAGQLSFETQILNKPAQSTDLDLQKRGCYFLFSITMAWTKKIVQFKNSSRTIIIVFSLMFLTPCEDEKM